MDGIIGISMWRILASLFYTATLSTLALAFTPTFTTPAISCGSFTVEWNVTGGAQAATPFSLLIVPVNDDSAPQDDTVGIGITTAVPVGYAIPDSAWDASNNKGTYTVDKFPLPTGERFIVIMDDGIGLGTGGVSTIQRVSEQSSDASCLPPDGQNSQILFGLSTQSPAQCSDLTILTAPPKAIRGFVPGGSPFSLDIPQSTNDTIRTEWTLDVATGTSFVLALELANGTRASSGLLVSGGDNGGGSACLADGPHSTIGLTGTATDLIATVTNAQGTDAPSSSKGKINVAAIVGGIVGGLAVLAVAALLTFFILLRRTDSIGRPRSRSRSTLSPNPAGHSYEFTSTSGESDWRRIGDSNAKAKKPDGKVDGGLEGRFGGGLFGGGKKKSRSGSGGAGRREGNLSSRQKREMYPGFSFASTQNRSVGVATEESFGRVGEDGRLPNSNGATMGSGSRGAGGANGKTAGVSGMPSSWKDAKRNEARGRSIDGSSYVSDSLATSPEEESRLGVIRESVGTGADLRREGSGYSGYHSSEHSRRQSFTLPGSGSNLLNSNSNPLNNSGTLPTDTSSSKREKERPSTAPTSTGSPMDYHLPSRVRSNHGHGEVEPTPLRMHEYPPDTKGLRHDQGEKTLLDDEQYDIEDDDSIPRVSERVLGDGHTEHTDAGGEEEDDFADALERGRERSWAHPYAMASSPHTDVSPLPFSTRQPSSLSHGHGSTEFTSAVRRGSNRDDLAHNPPTIIRHVDAGSMDDDDSDRRGGRRRVLELPPSYEEVPRGGRRRRE